MNPLSCRLYTLIPFTPLLHAASQRSFVRCLPPTRPPGAAPQVRVDSPITVVLALPFWWVLQVLEPKVEPYEKESLFWVRASAANLSYSAKLLPS